MPQTETHGNETLVVMAKAPRPGQVKTRLHAAIGVEAATRLYRAFLIDTLACARELARRRPGLGIAICYAPGDAQAEFSFLGDRVTWIPQRGAGLGARLANCFDDVHAVHGGPVVAIGGDSPSLPVNFLESAFHLLASETGAVFGPVPDGGYYAVGLRRPDPRMFDDVEWSTGSVLDRSLQNARRLGLSAATLPSWFDVDEYPELRRLGHELAANPAAAPATFAALAELGLQDV